MPHEATKRDHANRMFLLRDQRAQAGVCAWCSNKIDREGIGKRKAALCSRCVQIRRLQQRQRRRGH